MTESCNAHVLDTCAESSSSGPGETRSVLKGVQVHMETFGCQMNILDSELVQQQLLGVGCGLVSSADTAQVVLLNTCSVRDVSEQKVFSRLGVLHHRKLQSGNGKKLLIGVLGCMAERVHTQLMRGDLAVDLLVGPNNLAQVPTLLAKAYKRVQQGFRGNQVALSDFRNRKGKQISNQAMQEDLEALDASRGQYTQLPHVQAYVRITRGCNKFCAFCVVPRTRGPEVHRDPQSIVDEIKRLVDTGVLEVTLLGQTINHYCYQHAVGRTTSFAQLLFRIHEEVPYLQRLRFLTSYPRDFTDETLDVMASCDRICKYLHIPAQSGSDRILKKMNRGYTRQQYLELVERARSRMPQISLLGDMIVGFSSETQEDFELSLSLLRQVQYKNVFVFKYSPRPGTVSHRRQEDDVPWRVKQERNRIMLQLQQEISLQHHTSLVGKQLQVLVEAKAKYDPCTQTEGSSACVVPIQRKSAKRDETLVRLSARTQGDHIVVFDGSQDFIGKCMPVRIVGATALTLRGEKIFQEAFST